MPVTRWLCLLVLVNVAGAPAGAQDTEPSFAPLLKAGRKMAGEWTEDDRLREGLRFDRYTVIGHRRERVELELRSPVPSRLTLMRIVGASSRVIARSEPTDTTAALDLLLPANGVYQVIAEPMRDDSVAVSYSLTLRSSRPLTPRDWGQLYPGRSPPSERYALLVGVSDYPGRSHDLNGGPLSDVAMMRDLLVARLGFRSENVLVLRDLEGNREQVIEAFRRHLGQAGPQGVALFYYSGHGMQLPENRGQTGSQDPEPDNKDEALALWGTQSDLYGYLLDDELGILADDLHAGRVIMILDQCSAGTGTRGSDERALTWADFGDGTVSIPPQLEQVPKPVTTAALEKRVLWDDVRGRVEVEDALIHARPGTRQRDHLLLASSLANEASLNVILTLSDGRSRSASLFTTALYQALSRATLATPMGAVMEQVRIVVSRVTARIGRTTQTPHLEGAWQEETLAQLFRQRRPQ